MSPERASPALQTLVLCAAWMVLAAHLGAVCPDSPAVVVWGGWCLGGLGLAAVARWLNRKWQHVEELPFLSPILLGSFVAPLLVEGGLRLWGTSHSPWEEALMNGLLAVMLGLATVSGLRTYHPLVLVSGLFVCLFAASISRAVMTWVGTVGFALLGVTWLALAHWSSIVRRLPQRSRRQVKYPLRSVALAGVVFLCPLLAWGVVQAERMGQLRGWLPSSGGGKDYDPSARRGIGDGDALVAGQEDIQSFGPIEDAPFRSSDEPSLYDLFDELYDAPVQKQKIDRAISLPRDIQRLAETQMAKSQQAHKEFSTSRRTRTQGPNKVADLPSTALFYLKGRTPLHLRHEVFDLFDGVDWYPVEADPPERQPRLSLLPQGKRSWLRWDKGYASYDYLTPPEPHAIKIVHLRTNRFPAPLHLWGLHIDLLHELDFFRWHAAELLEMNRESLPELTAIHYRTQTIDVRRIPQQSYWGRWYDPRARALPDLPAMDRIRRLAEEWAGDRPPGWPQIEAVIQRLRQDYVHDRAAKPPEDAACPVEHFLFESRRGPDYLFATAAAVLLRSLGYSTRLVAGFYASPERYETRRDHTPIMAADTHVWVEVYHLGRTWITLEPTPGYAVLGPPPSWAERLLAALTAAGEWLAAWWWSWVAGLAGMLLLWIGRAWWLDVLCGWWWRWFPARTARRRILQTFRLIEFRLRLQRQGRPRACPPAEWYRQLDLPTEAHRTALVHLARLADWAVFAPLSSTPPGPVQEVCRAAFEALPRPRAIRLGK